MYELILSHWNIEEVVVWLPVVLIEYNSPVNLEWNLDK